MRCANLKNKVRNLHIVLFLTIAVYIGFLVFIVSVSTKEEPKDIAVRTTTQAEKNMQVLSVEEELPVRLEYIGNFRLTAYCPCSKCCGKWGKNRPKDEAGNDIVYTASGATAQANKTVAVDTNVIPYGTILLIDGQEYTAQDTGSKIKGQVIDIYFDNHEKPKIMDANIKKYML